MSKSDTHSDEQRRYDPEKYEANAEQRAKWEAFSFAVRDDGTIEVTNESHENPDDHQYLVSLDDRLEDGCTCEAAQYFEEDCKHRRAARNHPAIRAAAETATEQFRAEKARADGGAAMEAPAEEEDEETCKNGTKGCGGPESNADGELSCFECYTEFETRS